MQLKNILFLHSSAELYGSDRSLLYLIQNLNKDNYRPIVLLPEKGSLYAALKEIPYVVVLTYDMAVLRRKYFSLKGMIEYGIKFTKSFFAIRKIIKEYKIDIVYTNTSVIFPGAIAAKSKKIKSVWHVREIIASEKEKRIVSGVVNKFADLVIANSKSTGQAISGNDTKVHVIYNAVKESDVFVEHCEKDVVTVAMAGRINRWKGQKLFVDMAERVVEQCPNVLFKIAGSAYTGEEKFLLDLEDYIAEKKLQDVVELVGQVSDMESFYVSSDIFVLPSIQPEPFGLVVIEAMEHKLPVIATRHGGPTEIITHKETGFLVDYISPNEMADYCVKLVKDWKLRKEIGENSQKMKRRTFSIVKTVSDIEALLDSL